MTEQPYDTSGATERCAFTTDGECVTHPDDKLGPTLCDQGAEALEADLARKDETIREAEAEKDAFRDLADMSIKRATKAEAALVEAQRERDAALSDRDELEVLVMQVRASADEWWGKYDLELKAREQAERQVRALTEAVKKALTDLGDGGVYLDAIERDLRAALSGVSEPTEPHNHPVVPKQPNCPGCGMKHRPTTEGASDE